MTRAEVNQMLSAVGIPVAYHHFPESSGQEPPFICFYYEADNDVIADNGNYVDVSGLTVELYTDNKDFDLEAAVETALKAGGMVYTRTEEYIDTERMYMEVYQMEVIINEQ